MIILSFLKISRRLIFAFLRTIRLKIVMRASEKEMTTMKVFVIFVLF